MVGRTGGIARVAQVMSGAKIGAVASNKGARAREREKLGTWFYEPNTIPSAVLFPTAMPSSKITTSFSPFSALESLTPFGEQSDLDWQYRYCERDPLQFSEPPKHIKYTLKAPLGLELLLQADDPSHRMT